MQFSEYLEKNGPSVETLAAMTLGLKQLNSEAAYGDYLKKVRNFTANEAETMAIHFSRGFDLAIELMAYMHMAQQARELTEKDAVE